MTAGSFARAAFRRSLNEKDREVSELVPSTPYNRAALRRLGITSRHISLTEARGALGFTRFDLHLLSGGGPAPRRPAPVSAD